MKWCIANGRIIDPSQNIDGVGDLWIEDGKVLGIDSSKEFNQVFDKKIDARGCFVSPGFIDLHVHLRDPGESYKEDILSGCEAAARGGFTTICCMPNTKPAIDNEKILAYVDEKAKQYSGVNLLALGAISRGQLGIELTPIGAMVSCETRCKELTGKGICALSEDGKSLEDDELYLEAMKEAKNYDLPIFSHAEGGDNPQSPEGELEGVLRDLELAKKEPCRLHFCHVSTKESLAAIENARQEGMKVTCETAPHYIALVKRENETDGNFKMNPPLRAPEDRQAIREGLQKGSIRAIATDHAPHSPSEKEGVYEEALNGIVGLETALPICYTELVQPGILSVIELMDRMSYGPARILGINRGTLMAGSPADITIFESQEKYLINRNDFKSKSRNTPFDGRQVWGKVKMTVVDGVVVYNSKELTEMERTI